MILFLCEIEIEVREIEEEFQGGDKKKREMENQREIWESKERIERFWVLFFFVFIIYLEYSFPLYEFWSFNTCIRMYECMNIRIFLNVGTTKSCQRWWASRTYLGLFFLLRPIAIYIFNFATNLLESKIFMRILFTASKDFIFFCKYVIFCFLINEV